MNAVPGLKPSSPFVRGASQAGIDYHTIIRTIITAALPPQPPAVSPSPTVS
ncbi:MAG: hypothetical protein LBD24_09700 [Spirochaetaceae bacterium]|nr:hypothetical protein [Spirochaetaceae bacterium]